jgi:protein ImuB
MPPADKSPASLRGANPAPSVKRQQSLALEPLPAAKRESPRATPVTRLWLCIHLSALPLESLRRDSTNSVRAVFDEQDGMRKVLLANREAQSAGIRPGFSVNAALALLPALELEQRDVQCEQRSLLDLAGWAEQFTSFVAIEAPTVLLLELAGSVRLFTGLQELRQTISEGLGEQGFSAALAIAPTPLAATWLAKAGHRVCIQDMANLGSALGALPLTCLGWPSSVCESLYGMGISRIGDCLRLPRQGFAKRFGAGRLLELDRAVGRLPDPRVSYRTPERFVTDYELEEELSDSELILNACRVLLQKLEQFLLTRQLAVQRIKFNFFHLQHPAGVCRYRCFTVQQKRQAAAEPVDCAPDRASGCTYRR